MKLTTQTIIGVIAGALIATILVLTLKPSPKLLYNPFRVDGNTLKSLYNSDFSKLGFYFTINAAQNRVDMQPEVYNSANTRIVPPAALLKPLTTGVSIPGNKNLDGRLYNLFHDRTGYLQLRNLVQIVNSNPGGYFDFTPAEYDRTLIYYKITPYNSTGRAINTGGIDARTFRLDPSPPAPAY